MPPSKSTVAVDGWQVKWNAYLGCVGCNERTLLNEPRYYLESYEAGELHTTTVRILRPHFVHDRRSSRGYTLHTITPLTLLPAIVTWTRIFLLQNARISAGGETVAKQT